MLDIQRSEVAYIEGVDVNQRAVCAEKHCPSAAPLAAMKVWRIWKDSTEEWKHFAFCSHTCFLTCAPVSAMGRA